MSRDCDRSRIVPYGKRVSEKVSEHEFRDLSPKPFKIRLLSIVTNCRVRSRNNIQYILLHRGPTNALRTIAVNITLNFRKCRRIV